MPPHHNKKTESVTPWIVSDDTAALIGYLHDAFGAEERGRVCDEEGRIGHAEVAIGGSIVMLFDRHDGWPASNIDTLMFGVDRYGSFPVGEDLWFDDLVVDGARIGCAR